MKEITFFLITKLNLLLYVGAILLFGSKTPGGHDEFAVLILLMEF